MTPFMALLALDLFFCQTDHIQKQRARERDKCTKRDRVAETLIALCFVFFVLNPKVCHWPRKRN